jgi:3-oxoadipate enol-lactonase
MKIEVSGGQVSMAVSGEGRRLVLLHSLLADRGSFARITSPLAHGFRVIVPDLPGFDNSVAVLDGLVAVADRVAVALRAMLGEERPILLGNGFGASVALTMAIRSPELAESRIVANGGAVFSESAREAFRAMVRAADAKGLEAVTAPLCGGCSPRSSSKPILS